ncbi:hypothetical protein CHS0354_000093 [Potamilus streckersoni]|uniref:Uncharacterized protein n=1 Tax=Potamilus streckersoni TaxID=2493646 RepID=A0AAE0TJG7_9BIVA|nr:hypothetical protein CHS0354_000093 [Potamilus streckersoni]
MSLLYWLYSIFHFLVCFELNILNQKLLLHLDSTVTRMSKSRGRALNQALSFMRNPSGLQNRKYDNWTPLECICNRRIQNILCRSCGSVFSGRVRKMCPIHPNEIHLMDFVCCPNCKVESLQEIGVCERRMSAEDLNNSLHERRNLQQERLT